MCQAALCSPGQINLAGVPGDNCGGSKTYSCQEHFHLLPCRILRFVEDDKGVIQRPSAHEGQGRDLDYVTLYVFVHGLEAEHFVERVIKRPQVRVHFLGQIPGQKTKALTGFDGGTH